MSASCSSNRSDAKHLERELFNATRVVYTKHLRSVLLDISSIENYLLINRILQNIVIPDDCFNWCVKSINVCESNMNLLFNKKLETDNLIKHFVQLCKIYNSDCITSDQLDSLSLPLPFKMYIIDLVKPNIDINVHTICSKYKNFLYVMDEAICTAVEYANFKALQIIYNICKGCLFGGNFSFCWFRIWNCLFRHSVRHKYSSLLFLS
ncbi:hypothetical protein RI129_005876 [Pyrocoelia pectoralis]|uniref:Uncharacterized protein n=1 Tax=Pyrocoelia pectoralis TaxID=417401 RepID=A0AAN7VFF1_9COLE